MDCANLGISVSNKSAASAPPLADNAENQGEASNSSKIILHYFCFLLSDSSSSYGSIHKAQIWRSKKFR